MLRTRIIPTLLLHNKSLVKTWKFGKFVYVGDPTNTVKIFNELEVDELCVLDISVSRSQRQGPDFDLLLDIASECFMPVSYGGGITSFEQAKQVYDIGFEKIVVNSAVYANPELITEIANIYGSQAVVVSMDINKSILQKYQLRSHSGKRRQSGTPVDWAQQMEERGAGELLLTSIHREGTYQGFDLELVRNVCSAVDIPVIAHGGAGNLQDIVQVVDHGASAVALGSLVVFQKKGMGILVNFPTQAELEVLLGNI